MPHSTSVSTPCDFMYCTLSRQRTRPVTCSTSRCLMAAGSVISDASTLATSAPAASQSDTVLERRLHGVGGRLHQRAMERRAHRQHHAALASLGLGHLDGALDGLLVAAHHDLAAAVVVGDSERLALRRFLAGFLGRFELDAEQGRHGADADRHRLLHRLAAQLHKPRGICKLQRADRGQCRIFAQRVAGDVARQALQRLAAVLFQDAHHAMLTAISAGWAFSVRIRSDSGPSLINFERFCFSASSTSWKTSRAVTNASARSEPMPTAWEPCPGKTKARLMGRFPPVFGLKRRSSYRTPSMAGTP